MGNRIFIGFLKISCLTFFALSGNTADEAEERAMEEVRKFGQELMQSWAIRKHERIVSEYDSRNGHRREGKKNSTGRAGSDE